MKNLWSTIVGAFWALDPQIQKLSTKENPYRIVYITLESKKITKTSYLVQF